MTSTTLTHLGEPPQPRSLIPANGWLWIGLCAAAFCWMFWYFLGLTARVSSDPNWSHVIVVPLISLYYIFQHKDRLRDTPKAVCWWALPLIFVGLLSYILWIYPGRNDMFRGYSMILTLFATVLFVLGPRAMGVLWFPITYLVFAVKISDSIWERIANRLQDIASYGSTMILQSISAIAGDWFTVDNNGNQITLGFMRDGAWVSESMNVAEACSGLRMLMAFVALGVALAFLFPRPWWQRLVMVSLAVPIAVAVNIGRVTAIGLIYTVDKQYAQGDFHIFVGLLMLIPAAGLFLLLGWVMDKIIIRDESETAELGEKTATARKADLSLASATAPGRSRRVTPLTGLLLGAALTLACGLVYAMVFNTAAGIALFPSLGLVASWILLGLGVVLLVLLGWLTHRLAPGRHGVAAITFAAAVVVGLIGTAAMGHHSALRWQQIVLNKESVALRQPLTELPLQKDGWEFVRGDTLPPEIVEELGTRDYISWWYRDTNLPEGSPGSLMRLHVAYYTGMVDTVPHVPDRCFVAGGVAPVGLTEQDIPLDSARFTADPNASGYLAFAKLTPRGASYGSGQEVFLPTRTVPTKRFTYRPEGGSDQHVSYFFAANGKFLASPNAVRLQGFDFRDRYSYYCKVEVQLVGESDPEVIRQRTTAVLNTFLPEIMACLPDWREVEAGLWPPDAKAAQTPAGAVGAVSARPAAAETAP